MRMHVSKLIVYHIENFKIALSVDTFTIVSAIYLNLNFLFGIMPWSHCPIFLKSEAPQKFGKSGLKKLLKNEHRFGGHTLQEFYRILAAMCVLIAVYRFSFP